MKDKYVYFVLSSTPTLFARLIRKVMRAKYNHTSVALDENLNEMYSFARKNGRTPLVAGMVKENAARYTLLKHNDVMIKVYKVPVTEAQYACIVERIHGIWNDKTYHYNLFSALLFPLFKGFKTYKAYTCIEFALEMLEETDVKFSRPTYKYHPAEIDDILHDYEIYSGRLLDYRNFDINPNQSYFEKIPIYKIICASTKVVAILSWRDIWGLLTDIGENVAYISSKIFQ